LEGAYLSEATCAERSLREAQFALRNTRSRPTDRRLYGLAKATGRTDRRRICGADLFVWILKTRLISQYAKAFRGLAVRGEFADDAQLLRRSLAYDMRDAKLEHAVLSFANLEQTDLSSAKLGETNLRRALKGTILLDADLKKADFARGISDGRGFA